MEAIVAAVASFKPSTMATTSPCNGGAARRRSCATEKCSVAKELCAAVEELRDGWRLKDDGVADSLVDDVEPGTAAGREGSMVDLDFRAPHSPPLCFTFASALFFTFLVHKTLKQ